MKQILIQKGKVKIEDIPAPLLEDNSALIEVSFSLISVGTEIEAVKSLRESLIKKAIRQPEDVKKVLSFLKTRGIKSTLSLIKGRRESKYPMGYSCSGIVLQVGSAVEGIKKGDRVACAGGGKAYHAEIVLVPKNLIVKIPDDCDLQDAASVALGSIAIQGLRRADIRLGENVAIIGLGLIGQITAQLAKISGCRTIGFDLDKNRVELAKKLGLNKGFVISEVDVEQEVLNFTSGYGVDATIITASSPSDKIVQQAIEITKKKGRVVTVGDVGLGLKRHPLYEKEIDFLISCSYGPGRYDEKYEEKGLDYPYSYVRWTEKRNMEEYLKLIAERKLDFKSLVSEVYDINNAPNAYQELIESEKKPLGILFDYNIESSKKIDKLKTRIEVQEIKKKSGILNVAIIGAGSFAKNTHLPNLKKLSDLYSVRAIADKIGSNTKDIAERFGCAYCTTNYKDVLVDPDVDVVIITTRHNLHAEIAMEAAKAGKAVFTEKPIALDQSELDEFIKVIQETKIPFMVGFNRRFSPSAVKAKEIISKRINPMIINYRVNAGYIPPNHWVQTEEGGGRIIGEACHMFDLFNYFTDSAVESIEVNAITPKTSNRLASDNFIATLKYTNGSICSLTYTSMGADELEKEYIEIYVDGKVLIIEDFKSLKILGSKIDGVKSRISEKGHLEELIAFAKCMKEGTTLPIPLEQLIDATRISFLINEMVGD